MSLQIKYGRRFANLYSAFNNFYIHISRHFGKLSKNLCDVLHANGYDEECGSLADGDSHLFLMIVTKVTD